MLGRRLFALAAFLGVAAGSSQSGSAVQKVLELLEENRAKVAADLAAEEADITEYTAYCDDEKKGKDYAIATATRSIAMLTASITDGEAQISSFQEEVATQGNLVAGKEQELAAATLERNNGKADFEASEKELVQSVDQLERAIMMLKQELALVQGPTTKASRRERAEKRAKIAAAVLSKIIDASWVNEETRQSVQGLLQQRDGDDLKLSQAQLATKSSAAQSGGMVEQLEEMKAKAEETLSSARTAEMKAEHTFQMISQSLTDAISNAKDRIASAKQSKDNMGQQNGKAKGELVETEKTKEADTTFLAALVHDCRAAMASWEERQSSAKEEMAVIEKAKAILTSGVKVFVQTGTVSKTSLPDGADLDDDSDDDESPAANHGKQTRQRVLGKLKALSRQFNSYALMEMVNAAAVDPFDKIRGLIEQMVAKLMNEANAEATQKGFCDEQLGKSRAVQTEKSMTIDKLQSRLDKASTGRAELLQSSKDLEAEIAALDRGTAEATKIRNEEEATYSKSYQDFKDSAQAVQAACVMLKEYYEGSSLVQVAQKTGDAHGQKMGDAHAIISILEMSAEDFTKMYMELEQQEQEAKDEFEKLKQDNAVSRAAKVAESRGLRSEIKSLDVVLENGKEDYGMVSKELDAVLAYIDKLRPQCETKVMSYEEKKARREAEIDGLKEALEILEGPVGLMQVRQHLRSSKKA